MTSSSLGEGEQLARRQHRRGVAIKSALFVVGMFTGVYGGWKLAESGFDIAAPWTPLASLLFTGLFLAAMLIGSILLSRQTDEIQRQYYYKVGALAGSVYVIVYPAWFMLWKGGFVPEPIHWLLFIIYWLSLVLGSAVYRLR